MKIKDIYSFSPQTLLNTIFTNWTNFWPTKYKKVSSRSHRAEGYKLENTLPGFSSRWDEAEEQSTQRQGNGTHPIGAAKREKNEEKNEDSLKDYGTTSNGFIFAL